MTQAVFFDLDGTFADTAPDLAHAVNRMREARGMPLLPLAATRPVTSLGARGLLNVAFGITPEHPGYQAMREEFLAIYETDICRESCLFPGMGDLIDGLEARRLRWGIVTNKSERLARLLLGRLEIDPGCIVGGDTTPHLKPHPAPLIAACRTFEVEPSSCVYLGDDRRDIDAAHAAGMRAAVAGWGYLNGGNPQEWRADWTFDRPAALLDILDAT